MSKTTVLAAVSSIASGKQLAPAPVVTGGDAWSKVVIAYDADTAAGTDANLITAHDLRIANAPIVPNGSNIVIDFSAGFVIAY